MCSFHLARSLRGTARTSAMSWPFLPTSPTAAGIMDHTLRTARGVGLLFYASVARTFVARISLAVQLGKRARGVALLFQTSVARTFVSVCRKHVSRRRDIVIRQSLSTSSFQKLSVCPLRQIEQYAHRLRCPGRFGSSATACARGTSTRSMMSKRCGQIPLRTEINVR